MIIFTTSDIHGNHQHMDKIINFIKRRTDIEYLIVCGDLTGDYKYNYFEELKDKQYSDYLYFKSLTQELYGIKVLYIRGNHDVFDVNSDDEMYLSNYKFKKSLGAFIPFELVNISMYGNEREATEQEMKDNLDDLFVTNSSIIVAHQPPYGCCDRSYFGSSAVKEFIYEKQPALYLCGHVHEAFGTSMMGKTRVFNAACDDETARGWVIDTASQYYEELIL